MFKSKSALGLPFFPKLAIKILLGVFCLGFFLDYQPVLAFPPIRKAVVHAQNSQTQTISAQSLPFSFQLPHPGYISTPYSAWHPGVDIAAGLGMPIKPVTSGIVTSARFDLWGYGLVVEVDHGQGYHSLYAHLGRIYVKEGQKIGTGEYLGEVGLTGHTSGPHKIGRAHV